MLLRDADRGWRCMKGGSASSGPLRGTRRQGFPSDYQSRGHEAADKTEASGHVIPTTTPSCPSFSHSMSSQLCHLARGGEVQKGSRPNVTRTLALPEIRGWLASPPQLTVPLLLRVYLLIPHGTVCARQVDSMAGKCNKAGLGPFVGIRGSLVGQSVPRSGYRLGARSEL